MLAKTHKELILRNKDEIPPPYGDLLDMLGFEGLCALSENYGGSLLYVPMEKRLFRPCYAKQIRTEYNGYNMRELCRKYAFSERALRDVLNNETFIK